MELSNSTLMNETLEYYHFLYILINLYKNVELVRDIYMYFGSFITIVGSILNLLCILIFYKSKIFRNSSFPIYVYVISVVDTLNILLRFLVPQLIENRIRNILVNDYEIYEFNQDKYDNITSYITSDYHCSTFLYIYNSFTLVSVWLMVAVSLERLLVIKFTLQNKFMIKLRAFFILIFIFIAIFSLNVFDLAPGLYIKPQWYANLTLLCERDDMHNTQNNSTRVYKRIGSFTFNTENFVLIRAILQSIVPFLVVLIFNSLIIYNFKQIKLAARGRGKSNSCVSVNSLNSNINITNSQSRLKKRSKRSNSAHADSSNCKLQIPKRSAIEFTLGSSRSPSPFNNLSIPNTPTSIVSALNLVDKSNAFLMPPGKINGSIGSNNSSANLSVATTTNLTATTSVNQSNNNGNTSSNSSDKISFMITPSTNTNTNKKHAATNTTNIIINQAQANRISLKRRANKIRLNRETDIMLIVLSFSILLSQLPFTIAWILIYYRNFLKPINNDLNTLYLNAKSPMFFYIIRLLEMCYFSLNFLFYITLSPSLRKELKKKLPEKLNLLLINLGFNIKKHKKKINNNNNQKSVFIEDKSNIINNNNNNNNSNNIQTKTNSFVDYNDYLGKIRSISPLARPNCFFKPTNTNKKNFKNIFTKCKSSKKNNINNNNNNNYLNSSNKIKIVIDDLYDDQVNQEEKHEQEQQIDLLATEQKHNKSNSLTKNKRIFNLSSPSFLNSLDDSQTIYISKDNLKNLAFV